MGWAETLANVALEESNLGFANESKVHGLGAYEYATYPRRAAGTRCACARTCRAVATALSPRWSSPSGPTHGQLASPSALGAKALFQACFPHSRHRDFARPCGWRVSCSRVCFWARC